MDCGTWCKKARTQGKFIYSTAPKAHSLSRSIISSFHFARNFSRCPQRRVNSEWQPSFLPSLLLSQGVCATSRGAKTHACIFLYSLSMDTDSAGQRYGRNDWNFIIRESAASLFFFKDQVWKDFLEASLWVWGEGGMPGDGARGYF